LNVTGVQTCALPISAASRFPPAVAHTFEDRSGRTATVSRGGSSIRPPGPRGLTYRAESKPQGRVPTARHDSAVGCRPAASDPGAPALTAGLGPADPAFPRPGGTGRRAHGRVREGAVEGSRAGARGTVPAHPRICPLVEHLGAGTGHVLPAPVRGRPRGRAHRYRGPLGDRGRTVDLPGGRA